MLQIKILNALARIGFYVATVSGTMWTVADKSLGNPEDYQVRTAIIEKNKKLGDTLEYSIAMREGNKTDKIPSYINEEISESMRSGREKGGNLEDKADWNTAITLINKELADIKNDPSYMSLQESQEKIAGIISDAALPYKWGFISGVGIFGLSVTGSILAARRRFRRMGILA